MGRVILTFDNGPNEEITPRVLAVLARHNVKASFFVIGEKLRKPELRHQAKQAHDAGHWIGNHSMTHTTPLGEDRRLDAPEREIGVAQGIIGPLSHADRFFRPFGGGGHLDRRLMSRAPSSRSSRACCGTSSRAIGTIPRVGWNARFKPAPPKRKRWSSSTTICRQPWRNSTYSFAGCRTRDIRSCRSFQRLACRSCAAPSSETSRRSYRTSNSVKLSFDRQAHAFTSARARFLAPTAPSEPSKVAVRR